MSILPSLPWPARPLLNTPNQTMLLALPVYHVFGMLASVIAITNGGHLVLIPNPRPLTNMKPAFKKFKPDLFPGVNTLFEKLLDEDWFLEHGQKPEHHHFRRRVPARSRRQKLDGGHWVEHNRRLRYDRGTTLIAVRDIPSALRKAQPGAAARHGGSDSQQ